jgi:hypothetical protein
LFFFIWLLSFLSLRWKHFGRKSSGHALAAQVNAALIGLAQTFQALVHAAARFGLAMESRPAFCAIQNFLVSKRRRHPFFSFIVLFSSFWRSVFSFEVRRPHFFASISCHENEPSQEEDEAGRRVARDQLP